MQIQYRSITSFIRSGLILFACLSILVVGCSKKYRLKRDVEQTVSPWPFHHGNAAGLGLTERPTFNGQLETIWEEKVSGKLAGPLSIYHSSLIYPSTRKRTRIYSLIDGRYLGKIKTKRPVQSGVTIADSIAFLAIPPKSSYLQAINLHNGKNLWKRRIKDVCPGSIIVNEALIVGSTEGSLYSLSISTGDENWKFEADQGFGAPPVVSGGVIYQPSDRGRLYLISVETGEEIKRVDLGGPIIGSAVVDQLVYVADVLGNLFALDPGNGQIVWQKMTGGPVWSAPALSRSLVIIGQGFGEVVAYDRLSGEEVWRYNVVEAVVASPIVIGEQLVVGTAGGQIYSLAVETGDLIDRAKVKGSIEFSPVTDGTRVYLATNKGRIVCLGDKNGIVAQNEQSQANQSDHQ